MIPELKSDFVTPSRELEFKSIVLIITLELPDPFAKISVDGSGQCHSTEVVKNTLDPKWNQHYDL